MQKNIPERRTAAILTKSVPTVTIISFFIYLPNHPSNVRSSSMKISWCQLVSTKKTPQFHSAFPDRNPHHRPLRPRSKEMLFPPTNLCRSELLPMPLSRFSLPQKGLRVTSSLSLLAALLQDKVCSADNGRTLLTHRNSTRTPLKKIP